MQDAELKRLKHQRDIQAFLGTVLGSIPDHELERDAVRFLFPPTQFIFEVFLAGSGFAGSRLIGQQLYAGIKESSKYACQADWQRAIGIYPFPVHLSPDPSGYVVKGGIGGSFRMEDVELYVIEVGQQVRVI